MTTIRLILITSSPLLGFISILLLRHYNSGLGGSLYYKRWYLRIGIIAILLSLISIVLYFVNPIFIANSFNNNVIHRLSELKWFEIIVNGIVGAIIYKVIDLLLFRKSKTKS